MIKHVTCILFIAGAFNLARSQSISPQVIANTGKSVTNGGFTLDYTLGELSVSSYTASGSMITEGFHQTYTTSSSVEEGQGVDITIHVYPNPTVDIVNISIDALSDIHFYATVYDELGRNIYNKLSSVESMMQIDLQTLSAGTYYIHLANQENNMPIKTIQIQKLSNQ